MSVNKTARQIIADLKQQYKGDQEALEEIERREKDIAYIEAKEKQGGYTGQPAIGVARMLEADLKTWF